MEGVELIRLFVPDYKEHEYTTTTVLEGIKLLARYDLYEKKGNTIRIGEMKTGKKWTQRQADKLGKLIFYSLIEWNKYKK